MKILLKIKQHYRSKVFRRGYDYAAGELLWSKGRSFSQLETDASNPLSTQILLI